MIVDTATEKEGGEEEEVSIHFTACYNSTEDYS
jgi:hypothetical protein